MLPSVGKKLLSLIVVIFLFIVFGMITGRGLQYSSFSSPLIFGIIFFFYFNREFNYNTKSYHKFISNIYKILIIGFLIEVIFNIISPDYLYELLSTREVGGYEKVRGKIVTLLSLSSVERVIVNVNSFYLGVQSASIVSLSALIWFFPFYGNHYHKTNNKIWFILSIIFFIYTFNFTSIVMFFSWILLSILLLPNSRKNLFSFSLLTVPFIIIGSYNFFSRSFVMTFGETPWKHYIYTFSEIVYSFFSKLPNFSKFFGIPGNVSIGEYTLTHEFGYFIILMKLGFVYVSIILFLNIKELVLAKKISNNSYITFMTKLNLIIFSIWHISLIHYHPALKTGPAQLFGLHIAIYLLYSKYNIQITKYFADNKLSNHNFIKNNN